MHGSGIDVVAVVAEMKILNSCIPEDADITYLFVPATFMARLNVMLILPPACARLGTA